MTAHGRAKPVLIDADDGRRVGCSACDWSAPAPGTGQARANQLHRQHLNGATT